MLDWTNLPALLREVEKNSSVFEDRTRKAKLYSNPSTPMAQSARNARADSGDDEQAFVMDGRLDPCSAAPNTIAEVVVEMLVRFVLWSGPEMRGLTFGRAAIRVRPQHESSTSGKDRKDRRGSFGEPNPAQDSFEAVPHRARNRRPCKSAVAPMANLEITCASQIGLLKEGQVFFQASEPIVEMNGYRQRNVVTGDVLVSRPPCLQPCDVQK